MSEVSGKEWDFFLSHYPDSHILQTAAWGDLKAKFGWSVSRVVVGKSGAQILFRKLPLGQTLAYIGKGPVGLSNEALWGTIDALCKEKRAIFLKVEPDNWGVEGSTPQGGEIPVGFQLSEHAIQPMRTIVVDISRPEEAILASMKQKTRYNIRLALKRGIVIRQSSDIEKFYEILQITSQRDQFGVHTKEYYQSVFDLFEPKGGCRLFEAVFDNHVIASLLVCMHGPRAWYLYGASSEKYREYMPTYLLQWETMRWARKMGCETYDLWGVPDHGEAYLEANFTRRSDGLWGVYRFKRGFGGELRRATGPWDRVYAPALYRLYRGWVNWNSRDT